MGRKKVPAELVDQGWTYDTLELMFPQKEEDEG